MCSLMTHTTEVRPSLRRCSLNLHTLNPITWGSPTGLPNSTHVSETHRGRQGRNYCTPLSKAGRSLPAPIFMQLSTAQQNWADIWYMYNVPHILQDKCNVLGWNALMPIGKPVCHCVVFTKSIFALQRFAKNSGIEFLKKRQAVQSLTLGHRQTYWRMDTVTTGRLLLFTS